MDTQPNPSDAPTPITAGMLLYPGFTLLDLAGPQAVFGIHGRTLLISRTLDPVVSDGGVAIVPNTAYDDCPSSLDVLFVPGGFGTFAALQDQALLEFLAEAGRTARYVTGVCSGPLLLAAAGLLDGYEATTHWASHGLLAATRATAVRRRVVTDRNRVTGGGVSAGVDFGLTLLAAMRGEATAKLTQLLMEYDPDPPFQTGSPETAGPELTQSALALLTRFVGDAPALVASDIRAPFR